MKAPKNSTENWAMQVNMGTIKTIVAVWLVAAGLILGGAGIYIASDAELSSKFNIPMASDGPSIFDPVKKDTDPQAPTTLKFRGQEASGPDSMMHQGQGE